MNQILQFLVQAHLSLLIWNWLTNTMEAAPTLTTTTCNLLELLKFPYISFLYKSYYPPSVKTKLYIFFFIWMNLIIIMLFSCYLFNCWVVLLSLLCNMLTNSQIQVQELKVCSWLYRSARSLSRSPVPTAGIWSGSNRQSSRSPPQMNDQRGSLIGEIAPEHSAPSTVTKNALSVVS
jgi:hypothetical protein